MSATAKADYFWRSAVLGIRHSPFVHLVAVSTLAIALFTAGLARGGMRLLRGLEESIGGEVEVTIYLADGISPERGEELAREIASGTGGQARYVAPAQALERLADELGDLAEAVTSLPRNPLPASVELRVPAELRAPERLAELARTLRASPGVAAVDYGQAAVERLSAISRALNVGGGVAFLVIVLATVITTSATLQLAIYARREEIEIQKLVGASDRFVKAPFLIEGLLQGLLGAALALSGLWAFSRWAGPRLDELFSFLVGRGHASRLLDARSFLEVVVAGCAVGLCGSLIAVGR
ncbi:MAG TPA: permease-like cell division protein FtsX, partial [Myxococcaceae bacterium]|nr:permease-like cell division protein FtsX [Myxococcaceae bacterium]